MNVNNSGYVKEKRWMNMAVIDMVRWSCELIGQFVTGSFSAISCKLNHPQQMPRVPRLSSTSTSTHSDFVRGVPNPVWLVCLEMLMFSLRTSQNDWPEWALYTLTQGTDFWLAETRREIVQCLSCRQVSCWMILPTNFVFLIINLL